MYSAFPLSTLYSNAEQEMEETKGNNDFQGERRYDAPDTNDNDNIKSNFLADRKVNCENTVENPGYKALLNEVDLSEYLRRLRECNTSDSLSLSLLNGCQQRRHFSAPVILHYIMLNTNTMNSKGESFLPHNHENKSYLTEPHFPIGSIDKSYFSKFDLTKTHEPCPKPDALTVESLLRNKLELERRRLVQLEEENKELWDDAILLTEDNERLSSQVESMENENENLREQVKLLQGSLQHERQVSLDVKKQIRFLQDKNIMLMKKKSNLREQSSQTSNKPHKLEKADDKSRKTSAVERSVERNPNTNEETGKSARRRKEELHEVRRDEGICQRLASPAKTKTIRRDDEERRNKTSFVVSEEGRMKSRSNTDMVQSENHDTLLQDMHENHPPFTSSPSSLRNAMTKESRRDEHGLTYPPLGNGKEAFQHRSPRSPPRNRTLTNSHPHSTEWGQRLQRSLNNSRDTKRISGSKMRLVVSDSTGRCKQDICMRASQELNLMFTSSNSTPSKDSISEVVHGALNEPDDIKNFDSNNQVKILPEHGLYHEMHDVAPDAVPASVPKKCSHKRRNRPIGVPPPFDVVTINPSFVQDNVGSLSWDDDDDWSVSSSIVRSVHHCHELQE